VLWEVVGSPARGSFQARTQQRIFNISNLEVNDMKLKAVLTLIVAGLALSVSTKAFADPDPNFWVFLCFGQSNMESGGRMEAQDKTVDKRFQVMADFDAPNRGWKKGNWYEAVPPLAAKGSGICMIDYFGRAMVANLPENHKVGVIKVSVPGCKIELFEKEGYQKYLDAKDTADWLRNAAKSYGGNPYQFMVDQSKLAQKDGVIKGFLLHQGESNPGDKEWTKKVKGIYDNLCKDLNLKPEETPFLSGETVNADQGGTCAGFNKIMADLPKTLPNSYVVSSAGVPCNSDHMHFSPAGSREFGKRYGETMLKAMGLPVKTAATATAPATQAKP
jgi:hypothetical protein